MGTKVEIKNLNSIRNVKRAIEAESERLIKMLEHGEAVLQQTKSFDAATGNTFSIRDKEEADDYRYFPEPDLTPFHLQDDFIESVKQTIPELQPERIRRYVSAFGLSEYDASVLTEEKSISDYFEKLISTLPSSISQAKGMNKSAANWMLGPVKSWLNENNKEISEFPLMPEKIAGLIALVDSGKLNFSMAASRIFPALLAHPGKDPQQLAMELNLIQRSDVSFLEPLVEEVLKKFPDKVKEFKKGKKGLISMFVGEVIKASKGKADPQQVNELLKEKLKS
jgi:aspartyl-tRNA(Asn)/glutamyl-tRNA(Gln) amidotransferase subunit B